MGYCIRLFNKETCNMKTEVNEVIEVSLDKNKKKQPKKGLIKRLSKEKTPLTSEDIKEEHDKATANKQKVLNTVIASATKESQKVVKAQQTAKTSTAKDAKAKADKEVADVESKTKEIDR